MKKVLLSFIALSANIFVNAQEVNYSVISVPEESSCGFVRITSDNDYVCMPIVKRNSKIAIWATNKVIGTSPDGKDIAFLSARNQTYNIFIKNLEKKSVSVQRTKRQLVTDFSYSPDGSNICFAEKQGKNVQIYQTSAVQGFVCRQITDGNIDNTPVYSSDMSQIFFARQEAKSISIWSYNIKNNYLSNFSNGMNPSPTTDGRILCSRSNTEGKSEIWRIDTQSGVEECIISDLQKSFTSPSLSPDGKWILFTGTGFVFNKNNKKYPNTDIYVAHPDGSGIQQLTFHGADDLSPVWSKDGKYIYFVSQRGSTTAVANLWRLTFNY
ncbi:MAG: PD40 domain-containing protein [Prevotella sp.]|nr:PD40 domain-containing protein [Prevotella sp.]